MVPLIPLSHVPLPNSAPKPAYVQPAPQLEAIALAALITKPRFGLRAGVGNWGDEGTTFVAGADLTLRVPGLPVPAVRLDIEGWSEFPPFGGGARGDAVSALAVFSAFGIGYAGIGPSYWHTNNAGRGSGLGAKGLVGINLISNLYIEGSVILGPERIPLSLTVGMRF
ncbi:MAG: hypothetical protein ACO1SV_27055 [Fimbriimonas sp.]